ncbi:MAG: cytochrome c oxidase subunit II [Bacteroidia bacterium]
MEIQSIISITQLLLLAILALVGYNLYMVFKLKDIDPFKNLNPNKINGILFLLFLIFGLIAAVWSTSAWADLFMFGKDAASEHGVWIDKMYNRTMAVSVLVVLVTNTLLFWFAFRYYGKPGRKALYYPHNNKLELIWTVVPAIVMAWLIADGVRNWHKIMDPSDEIKAESLNLEFYARQFDWTIRYPGADGQLGQAHVKYIDNDKGNSIGLNFQDEETRDDIIVTEIHVPVDQPICMNIRSQDVLHSATLAHFRVKMDAVPGMPTKFYFTPKITTKKMREMKDNPDFVYELSCQQICGSAHYNMRRVLVVETQEEYDEWLKAQRPFYQTYLEINGLVPEVEEAPAPVPTEPEPTATNGEQESDKEITSAR